MSSQQEARTEETAEQPLSPSAPLWAWAYREIGERADTMLSHLGGVREGADIEAVHDMRVWSRRLVASMKVFAACFPDDDYRALLREARRVTRALGSVRDLDVLIDHYEKLDRDADPDEHLGIQYLLALYRLDHRRVRKPMLTALDRVANSKYPERLRRYLRREAQAYSVGLGPEATRGPSRTNAHSLHGEQPFRTAAPIALEERHAELYYFEPFVAHPEMAEELHEMRIGAKWLRYTMELFAPAYADGLKEPLAAVKKLQELLGDLHDSDVRLDRLTAVLAEPLDAHGMEPLGVLLPEQVVASLRLAQKREQRVRDRVYKAFYKEWKKLDKAGFKATSAERLRHPDA